MDRTYFNFDISEYERANNLKLGEAVNDFDESKKSLIIGMVGIGGGKVAAWLPRSEADSFIEAFEKSYRTLWPE